MANDERLFELKDAIEAKKKELASDRFDVGSAPWAKQKQQLAELAEEHELLLESQRVAAAVREWEELHPPVRDDCPICLEPIRLGWAAHIEICPTCMKGACRECWKGMVDSLDDDTIRKCPLCRANYPNSDYGLCSREPLNKAAWLEYCILELSFLTMERTGLIKKRACG